MCSFRPKQGLVSYRCINPHNSGEALLCLQVMNNFLCFLHPFGTSAIKIKIDAFNMTLQAGGLLSVKNTVKPRLSEKGTFQFTHHTDDLFQTNVCYTVGRVFYCEFVTTSQLIDSQ